MIILEPQRLEPGQEVQQLMQQRGDSEALGREKKNQKNIYVHKIKSLMRISQDTLLQDEKDISVALNKKQIKKARSEIDKAAIKLQKNRESAKRARLRKKLYIKLLEKRVERLRDAAEEGARIEKDCQQFLQMISCKEGRKEKKEDVVDEVQKYLSSENLGKASREEQDKEKSLALMDKLVEEICQVSVCSSLKNIRELSSQISLEEIIKAEQSRERQLQGEELQEIIKSVLVEGEHLRSIYADLLNENERVKRGVSQVAREEGVGREEQLDEEFSSYLQRNGQSSNIFINLSQGEKTIIEGECYLQQIINEQDEV